jgi:hypothetical protein
MKNKFHNVKIALLFGIAVLLLALSAVGSAQAALTYYSENYGAEVTVSNIGVTLLENGTAVSRRDYLDDGRWEETTGQLLTNLVDSSKNETFTIGKSYPEALSVYNSGSIDTFVRVILTKSWVDAQGKKDTKLSPELIELSLTGDGWLESASASASPERTVLYYSKVLPAGQTTSAFSDTIRVNSAIATKVTEERTQDADGNTLITTTFSYDGYRFLLEAEVDAVQTHHAQEAIKSAWGVDVIISGDSLSLS